MARAIEIDEHGMTVLTDGIAFAPLPGKLLQAQLIPGDVLVWYSAGRNRKSSVIREFSEGPYSHVGIYTGHGLSIDAGPDGVRESDLDVDEESYVQVVRKEGLTVKQQAKVVARARKFVNYRYAWLDAIALPLRRRAYYRKMNPRPSMWDWVNGRAWLHLSGTLMTLLRERHPPTKKIFCSQIVVEAYAAINHFPRELVNSGIFTPSDLAVDSSFTHAGWFAPTGTPIWHPLDPYSPDPVDQRHWRFSLTRIVRGTGTGGK